MVDASADQSVRVKNMNTTKPGYAWQVHEHGVGKMRNDTTTNDQSSTMRFMLP